MVDSRRNDQIPSDGENSSDGAQPVQVNQTKDAGLKAGQDPSPTALSHERSHISFSLDAPVDDTLPSDDVPDEVYDRLSPNRKLVIVSLLSFCSFLAPISSTTVLAATPEVAAEYNTSGAIINLSNALYMLWMGISPLVWGPLSQVYGRRPVGFHELKYSDR